MYTKFEEFLIDDIKYTFTMEDDEKHKIIKERLSDKMIRLLEDVGWESKYGLDISVFGIFDEINHKLYGSEYSLKELAPSLYEEEYADINENIRQKINSFISEYIKNNKENLIKEVESHSGTKELKSEVNYYVEIVKQNYIASIHCDIHTDSFFHEYKYINYDFGVYDYLQYFADPDLFIIKLVMEKITRDEKKFSRYVYAYYEAMKTYESLVASDDNPYLKSRNIYKSVSKYSKIKPLCKNVKIETMDGKIHSAPIHFYSRLIRDDSFFAIDDRVYVKDIYKIKYGKNVIYEDEKILN